MPQLIDYIDKIARDKNRDVLYLLFKPQKGDDPILFLIMKPVNAETRSSSGWRKTTSPIIHAWESGLERAGLDSYNGFLYIDVPYDEADADFKKLALLVSRTPGWFHAL